MRGGGWKVRGGGWRVRGWRVRERASTHTFLRLLTVLRSIISFLPPPRGGRAGEADIVGGDVHLPKVTLAVEALPLAHAHL